jgi:hypothetical protein
MNVYVLYFLGPDAQGRAFGKFLGVFSSQARAARVVERLQSLPAYRHYPMGFQVDAIELDGDVDQDQVGPPPPNPVPPPDFGVPPPDLGSQDVR